MRIIDEIIIHTTATPPNWRPGDTTEGRVAAVRDWHVNGRGWSDIGYHYLIDRDGTVAEGRPVMRTGAHVSGRNARTIGVALFGGMGGAANDEFADHYTPAQDRALRALIDRLQAEHGPDLHLSGHHEYANKACPCFDVRSWSASAPRDDHDRHRDRIRATLASIADEADEALATGWAADLPADIQRDRWALAAIRNLAEVKLED